MKVVWEVEDGYVGPSAYQTTYIDDEELEDFPEGEERDAFINECVQEDFEQKITFSIKRTEES